MDGVKVALGNRGTKSMLEISVIGDELVKAARQRPFLLGPVFFQTALPCSGGYHLERGGMPLHDAVGISCKKDATTKYQGADVKYMG